MSLCGYVLYIQLKKWFIKFGATGSLIYWRSEPHSDILLTTVSFMISTFNTFNSCRGQIAMFM